MLMSKTSRSIIELQNFRNQMTITIGTAGTESEEYKQAMQRKAELIASTGISIIAGLALVYYVTRK